jgi:hypothetical protein
MTVAGATQPATIQGFVLSQENDEKMARGERTAHHAPMQAWNYLTRL